MDFGHSIVTCSCVSWVMCFTILFELLFLCDALASSRLEAFNCVFVTVSWFALALHVACAQDY